MFTYIYCRVSTHEQFITGHSIEAQARACLDYVRANGLVLGPESNCGTPGIFVDGGRSAYKKTINQRPGGAAMVAALRNNGSNVVATSLHRLFRRFRDMAETTAIWEGAGVSVHFVDYGIRSDTANGRLLLHILAAVAQWKSEISSARVKEAFAHKKIHDPKLKRAFQPRHPVPVKKDLYEFFKLYRSDDQQQFTGKVFGYLRVSTDDQTLEQQQAAIEKHLLANPDLAGKSVDWKRDAGVSAYKVPFVKRPAGAEIMAEAKAGDMVVVLRPDRMFRSIHDMANTVALLKSRGIFLYVADIGLRTDQPFGETMVSMLSLVAEIESKEISRSTRHGHLMASAKGSPGCRLPRPLDPSPHPGKVTEWAFKANVFSADEWYGIHADWWLQMPNFEHANDAAKYVCSIWFKRVGYPYPCLSCTREKYIKQILKAQREEFTLRRDKLLSVVKALPKGTAITIPVGHFRHGGYNPKNIQKFMQTMMKVPAGADRKTTARLLRNAPPEAVETVRAILG
jgi:DNA invertase Pin-like site-specific DNA recombinase